MDVHEVIDQITQILDPKNVHWTIRVAKAIGKARPSGQLYEFLGDELVNRLWGPHAATEADALGPELISRA